MPKLTDEEIRRGWEQARTFPDDPPLGTYTVAIRDCGSYKRYLLTDGCDNWYFTTDYLMRLDEEMKRARKRQHKK